MRLLILSFYFPPDLSAGSFRTSALVSALRRDAPPGTQIDVVTTLPNRYHTFSTNAAELETAAGLEVRRIPLRAHRSDMLGQSRAFLAFARQALRHLRGRKYDVVFATSSRLMTAALGAFVSRRLRAPLYLDIRDIFVDTIGDVLPPLLAGSIKRIFSLVESWTMRRAQRINLVSEGFADYFRARYAGRPLTFFTNGIDDEFLAATTQPVARPEKESRTTVLYAGNIGEGQCLHEIVPTLARALRDRVRFIIIGDGGRRAALQSALVSAAVDNVELRDPMPRAQLLGAYQAADVLFLHLGGHPAFEKVLPSKLFEYAALGKPVLAGVAGYAAQFTRTEITNSAVFPPGNLAAALAAFDSLQIRDRQRPEFISKYARASIARAMAADILVVAGCVP